MLLKIFYNYIQIYNKRYYIYFIFKISKYKLYKNFIFIININILFDENFKNFAIYFNFIYGFES